MKPSVHDDSDLPLLAVSSGQKPDQGKAQSIPALLQIVRSWKDEYQGAAGWHRIVTGVQQRTPMNQPEKR
ncbi:MAG: hypothetical protein E7813_23895 [Bradyrhizobium sp.]|uniref:hypothetical protein n=1 Tax=Bradyrhizobium sp. TaxID=376 RepID=UPI00121A0807|nr:hypothetical protein [Bradyrhizobium sp.]THD60018.1 MAG: hypothetical protein E7813_23895 [Bradyrhizobium sp.]